MCLYVCLFIYRLYMSICMFMHIDILCMCLCIYVCMCACMYMQEIYCIHLSKCHATIRSTYHFSFNILSLSDAFGHRRSECTSRHIVNSATKAFDKPRLRGKGDGSEGRREDERSGFCGIPLCVIGIGFEWDGRLGFSFVFRFLCRFLFSVSLSLVILTVTICLLKLSKGK